MEHIKVIQPPPRKSLPAGLTPPTNVSFSQHSTLEPYPNGHPNRSRRLSTNTLMQEIVELERRHIKQRKPKSSECSQSCQSRPASFKDIVYQHQLKKDQESRFKKMQKYQQALPEEIQEELGYSTFKMVQQNQKNKLEKMRKNQGHCKNIYPRCSLDVQLSPEERRKRS